MFKYKRKFALVELLQNPDNMVLMYPQGKIHSIYDTQFSFEPGIEKILERSGDGVQVMFFSALVDYHAAPRPTVSVRLKEYDYSKGDSRADLANAYSAHYQESIEKQKAVILQKELATSPQ